MVPQTGESANFAFVIKSEVDTFYIYVIPLVCFLPILSVMAAQIYGLSTALNRLLLFSCTPIFLIQSSLNPVIYCWKMRHIRHAVMNILRTCLGA